MALDAVDVRGRRQGDLLVPESSFGRFPESHLVKDIPQSLTIVPRELMRQQADFSLKEALRNVTGISLVAGEGGGSRATTSRSAASRRRTISSSTGSVTSGPTPGTSSTSTPWRS